MKEWMRRNIMEDQLRLEAIPLSPDVALSPALVPCCLASELLTVTSCLPFSVNILQGHVCKWSILVCAQHCGYSKINGWINWYVNEMLSSFGCYRDPFYCCIKIQFLVTSIHWLKFCSLEQTLFLFPLDSIWMGLVSPHTLSWGRTHDSCDCPSYNWFPSPLASWSPWDRNSLALRLFRYHHSMPPWGTQASLI